jgi:hypothetical protein
MITSRRLIDIRHASIALTLVHTTSLTMKSHECDWSKETTHGRVRDAVGFAFGFIAAISYGELCLDTVCREQARHRPNCRLLFEDDMWPLGNVAKRLPPGNWTVAFALRCVVE